MITRKKEISVFQIINRLFKMVFVAAPALFIIYVLIVFLVGASGVVNTFISQKFFDSVSAMVSGDSTVVKTILMALSLGLALILTHILNGLVNFMGLSWWKSVAGNITGIVNIKIGKIDPVLFEDTNVLDDINKAHEGVRNSMILIIVITLILTMYLPYFLFMGIYLYKLKPLLSISLIFIFIPIALTQFIRVSIFGKLEDEVAPLRREYDYYEGCIVNREYYKETRMLGSFGAIFASVGLMFELMEEMICGEIGEVTAGLGTVRNFIRLLELPERSGEDIEIKNVPDINLESVSFSYPSTNKVSVNNINLYIKAGETIAIVGENGAGKTTLVKLIIGLYLPSEGEILIDGFNTKDVSQKYLYKGISAVFQNYQRYKMTLGENISISDVDKVDDNNFKKDVALKKADLFMDNENFKDGYETMLSREFDGVDLSGGQWQRVAIARGFYSSHNMIVLDEPTAAIDPVEETKIYNKFKEMSQGKTSIIVTHRLGSAKIADKIIVMDKGEIIEVGTHDELIINKGKYQKMYDSQSKWYVK